MSDAYYTFHYLFTGKNQKRLRLHSLHAFVSIMLAMRADPLFVREEILARGYDITDDMIHECKDDKMPSEPEIYLKWISAITEGVVQSRYGYQKLARALGIPICVANAEYDARQVGDHVKRPVHDISSHEKETSMTTSSTGSYTSSQSLPNITLSQLPPISAAMRPETENRYKRATTTEK